MLGNTSRGVSRQEHKRRARLADRVLRRCSRWARIYCLLPLAGRVGLPDAGQGRLEDSLSYSAGRNDLLWLDRVGCFRHRRSRLPTGDAVRTPSTTTTKHLTKRRCNEPRDSATSVPFVLAIHTSYFMESFTGLAVADLESR